MRDEGRRRTLTLGREYNRAAMRFPRGRFEEERHWDECDSARIFRMY